MQQYDVIVIGSGPGGEGAAMKCAKAGKKVAVVEAYAQVGAAARTGARSRPRPCGRDFRACAKCATARSFMTRPI